MAAALKYAHQFLEDWAAKDYRHRNQRIGEIPPLSYAFRDYVRVEDNEPSPAAKQVLVNWDLHHRDSTVARKEHQKRMAFRDKDRGGYRRGNGRGGRDKGNLDRRSFN